MEEKDAQPLGNKKLHMPFRRVEEGAESDSDWDVQSSEASPTGLAHAPAARSSSSSRSPTARKTPEAKPIAPVIMDEDDDSQGQEDLFGEDDLKKTDDKDSTKDDHSDSNNEDIKGRNDLFGGEVSTSDEGEDQDEDRELLTVPTLRVRPKQRIEQALQLGPCAAELRKVDHLYLMKLPNFLHIDPEPFDEATFVGEENEPDDEEGDGAGRVKLKIENTLRWRQSKTTGEMESNAYFVQWSDDSLSLVVGNEVFDVSLKDLQDQHQYLLVRHAAEGQNIFEAQCKLQEAMAFRPSSTASLTHKKLTATVLAKHQRVSRTIFHRTVENPERRKQEAERLEQEQIRSRRKLAAQQRQSAAWRGSDRLTADDLEAEDWSQDERDSYAATRRLPPKINRKPRPAGDEEESGYDEEAWTQNEYEKDGFVVDDDEDIEVMDEEEEEEEDGDFVDESEEEERERSQEQRLLAAKRGLSEQTAQSSSTPDRKQRRVVLSDDEMEDDEE